MSLEEQIAVLVAVTDGVFDHMPVSDVERASRRMARELVSRLPEMFEEVEEGEELTEEQLSEVRATAHRIGGARR
jgi:F-type H+-transporting ATPase subunit alpha